MLLTVVRLARRGRAASRSGHHALLHRRRGSGRAPGRGGARQRPPRGVRGCHRRRGRGRWLQHHRAWPADLSDRGRREGHGLDEADRPRVGRPRIHAQRRQRGDQADRGADTAGRLHLADPSDADHGGAARHGVRIVRDRGDAGERAQPGRRVRRRRPGCSGRSSATPSTRRCSRRLQGQRRPDRRPPRTSTRARCRATTTSSSTR